MFKFNLNIIKNNYFFIIFLLIIIVFVSIKNSNERIENFADRKFDKILNQCYNLDGKKIKDHYYYAEKNETVSSQCISDCGNPKYKNIMGNPNLYLLGPGRNNNSCLDKYPIVYLRLNKVMLNGEFLDISGYPNNVITGMTCIKKETEKSKKIYTCVRRNTNDDLFYSYAVFNGKNDYLTVEGEHLNNIDLSISISLWICPISNNKKMCLFKKGKRGWSLLIDSDNKLLLKIGQEEIKSKNEISKQRWSYIALTLNQIGDNILGKLYINGIEDSNIEFDNTYLPTGKLDIKELGRLVIGCSGLRDNDKVFTEHMYHGRMRNFKLYNYYMKKKDIDNEFSSSMMLSKIRLNKENKEDIKDEISFVLRPNRINGTNYDDGDRFFNGDGDYMKIDNDKLPHHNMSWGLIFSSKSTMIKDGVLMQYSLPNPHIDKIKYGKEIKFFLKDNLYRISFGSDKIEESIKLTNINPDTEWHVHAFTFNSASNKFYYYYDGKLALEKEIMLNLGKPIIYFGNSMSDNLFWIGSIREIQIYKTVIGMDIINKQKNKLLDDALGLNQESETQDLETKFDYILQGLGNSQELSSKTETNDSVIFPAIQTEQTDTNNEEKNKLNTQLQTQAKTQDIIDEMGDDEIIERLKKVCNRYISLPSSNNNMMKMTIV